MRGGMATTQVMTNANRASTTVSTSRSPISSAFGRWYSSESPRLPLRRFCIHLRYCTHTGRSRPNSCRSAWICSALIELPDDARVDRKSTRLNSSHLVISYAVFCLKKKKSRLELCHGIGHSSHHYDK